MSQKNLSWILGGAVVIIGLFFGLAFLLKPALTTTATNWITGQPAAPTATHTPTATPTDMPTTQTTAVPPSANAGNCNAYKIDFTKGQGVPPYRIDVGSPNEREIVNVWSDGSKETTYILPRMTVIRSKFTGYGNMWKFPDDCDFENLVERAINYAKQTTSSNHTGEVYLLKPDGSTVLITDNAFNFVLDYSNLPNDPTK